LVFLVGVYVTLELFCTALGASPTGASSMQGSFTGVPIVFIHAFAMSGDFS
jgi:hypothetical protein